MTIDEKALQEIEARAKAATSGPWRKTSDILQDCGCISTRSEDLFRSYASPPTLQTSRDCDFIAHARQDVPSLLAEVGRLREALEEIAKSGCVYDCNRTRCTSDNIARRALGRRG